MTETLKAPFPYFGGKSRVADEVWSRFGAVNSYVEPFFGSGAVLLGRPGIRSGIETVNDKHYYLANFWRALQADPLGLAKLCNWPVNEVDLYARHLWLVNEGRQLIKACYTNPDYYDLKVAAWWVWGLSMWIGHGWCVDKEEPEQTVMNKMPDCHSNKGVTSVYGDGNMRISGNQGVHQKRPSTVAHGVTQKRPAIAGHKTLDRKRPKIGRTGSSVGERLDDITEWFQALADRMRSVRVCCGDWSRICGPSITEFRGICGVFLDPPYTDAADRDSRLYSTDDLAVGREAHAWAVEHGDKKSLRIAICGYEGEYMFPKGWKMFNWKAAGGYSALKADGKGMENSKRERIWFSPYCLEPQPSLFEEV